MIPVPAEVQQTCHVARVVDKPSVVMHGPDDTSEPSCGALGALVPWAGHESSGLSRGPYRCSEEAAKADGERDNPQDDGSCGADVGALYDVLLGDCKTHVDGDVCAGLSECRDAGTSDDYPSTACGSTVMPSDRGADMDTCPWTMVLVSALWCTRWYPIYYPPVAYCDDNSRFTLRPARDVGALWVLGLQSSRPVPWTWTTYNRLCS